MFWVFFLISGFYMFHCDLVITIKCLLLRLQKLFSEDFFICEIDVEMLDNPNVPSHFYDLGVSRGYPAFKIIPNLIMNSFPNEDIKVKT